MVDTRQRFDEELEIIRRAWTQDEMTFDGAFYRCRGCG